MNILIIVFIVTIVLILLFSKRNKGITNSDSGFPVDSGSSGIPSNTNNDFSGFGGGEFSGGGADGSWDDGGDTGGSDGGGGDGGGD